MRFIILAACGLLLGGCAVTRGTESTIQLESSPPGAQVSTRIVDPCSLSECPPMEAPDGQTPPPRPTIADAYGPNCVTPCSIRVSRKDALLVTFTLAGYQPATVPVTTRVAGAGAVGVAGNVLIGGVVGLGVDAATGAALEHQPNPVVVTLAPTGRGPAPRGRK